MVEFPGLTEENAGIEEVETLIYPRSDWVRKNALGVSLSGVGNWGSRGALLGGLSGPVEEKGRRLRKKMVTETRGRQKKKDRSVQGDSPDEINSVEEEEMGKRLA